MQALEQVPWFAFDHECSWLVSNVRASRKGVASHCACLHKCRRCCRMHMKARIGGERARMWIRLSRGEFRVNRAACRRNWGCTGWGGMSWSWHQATLHICWVDIHTNGLVAYWLMVILFMKWCPVFDSLKFLFFWPYFLGSDTNLKHDILWHKISIWGKKSFKSWLPIWTHVDCQSNWWLYQITSLVNVPPF